MKNLRLLHRFEELGFVNEPSLRLLPVHHLNMRNTYLVQGTESEIHEIAHQAAHNFPFTQRSIERTSSLFEHLNRQSKALGLAHECHALAIEKKLLRKLGWLRYIDFDRFIRNIRETGYSGPAFPFETMKILMASIAREENFPDQVDRAWKHLLKLGAEEEPVKASSRL